MTVTGFRRPGRVTTISFRVSTDVSLVTQARPEDVIEAVRKVTYLDGD